MVGGKTTTIESCRYMIALMDSNDEKVDIEVFGIEKISSPITTINLSQIAKLLEINANEIQRPDEGEIDILIGMQYAGFHPVRVNSKGHLLLLQNRFGSIVAGSHRMIKETTKISQSCLQVKHAIVLHSQASLERFLEIESLGVSCEPKCGGCKCGTCQLGGKSMSIKDERELSLIEEGIKFDSDKGRWIAKYPWIKTPNELQNNRHVAMAVLKSIEKRLAKDDDHRQLYERQIDDLISRGAARLVTEEELASYDGPQYYITHFAVMNPKSKSTPCRIVFNSSANYMGHSLNEYLAKGPSLLNVLIGILLRFRTGRYAFIGDISKMYHSIDIPLHDQMTHLFLWRECKTDQHPTTYAISVVNMGDRPSAAIAQIALRKSAELSAKMFPEAASIIIENSYMDDVPASVDHEQEAMLRMTEIEGILSERGFKIKEWIHSGKINSNEKSKDQSDVQVLMGLNEQGIGETEGVLGMHWNTINDNLLFKVNTPELSNKVSKRMVLSAANKIYDPLGLITPFTVRLKILMRSIWANEPKIGWDDQIPAHILETWRSIVQEMTEIGTLTFKRSITPSEEVIGGPKLVIFSDGSEKAYGSVAYARWKTKSAFTSLLVAAKSRVAPLKKADIVRLELCGATLSTRLRKIIQREMKVEFENVIHIVDSEIVKAMISKESYGFNTFAGNRLGEIQTLSKPEEWRWVAGKPWINVADLITRGTAPLELKEDSIWQKGPKFLSLPEEEWPTCSEVSENLDLPERKHKFVGTAIARRDESLLSRFDLDRFSKWRLLVHTTVRIFLLYEKFKKVQTGNHLITAKWIKLAEDMWIKEAQQQINIDEHFKLRPVIENGIIMVGGRTERWMGATWNLQKFILLPKNHQISKLISSYVHVHGGHLGISATVAKIRSQYWIIGVRKLVTQILLKCVKCRRKQKRMCEQIMSTLPIERIQPSPAFANIGVDYFGPFSIKGEVHKRVRGKCFGVLITCLSSRAAHIDITADYGTDSFLQLFRRFSSFRGWPTTVFSDRGTQLVRASKELKEIVISLDWTQIQQYSSEKGFDWKFSPADSPWYNGAVEALVKTTKHALTAAIGENVMTYSELQTCVMEAGELVNERPIGLIPSSPDEGSYLCPNDLLLGRSSAKVPQGPFKERTSIKHRFDFIQQIVGAFWKRWMREVFPSLVIQPKWHTERRNVKTGDIVLIRDTDEVRGKWIMAKITKAKESADGKVRKASVSYRSATGIKQEVERAIQRMILLVPVDDEY